MTAAAPRPVDVHALPAMLTALRLPSRTAAAHHVPRPTRLDAWVLINAG